MGPSRVITHHPWICSQTHICSQTSYRGQTDRVEPLLDLAMQVKKESDIFKIVTLIINFSKTILLEMLKLCRVYFAYNIVKLYIIYNEISSKYLDVVMKGSIKSACLSSTSERDTIKSLSYQNKNKSPARRAQKVPIEIPTTCKYKWLFLVVPWGCLQFVIVVFPDHTHLLFLVPNHIKM